MFRRIALPALLAMVVSAAGCDEGLPLESTPVLAVQMSVAPDPGMAVPSSGVTFEQDGQTMEFPWMTTLSLIIRTDASQSGATIRNIGASVQEAIEGIAVTPVLSSSMSGTGCLVAEPKRSSRSTPRCRPMRAPVSPMRCR